LRAFRRDFPASATRNWISSIFMAMRAHDPVYGGTVLAKVRPTWDGPPPRLAFEEDGSRPWLVSGESGSGKTSFLAAVLREAERRGLSARFVPVASQCGTTTLRGLVEHLEERLAGVLEPRNREDANLPGGWSGRFRRLLARVPATHPLAIILDDVDRLESIYTARELAWLPRRLLPHIKVVLSAADTQLRDRLRFATHLPLPGRDFRERLSFRTRLAELEQLDGDLLSDIVRWLAFARVGLSELEILGLASYAGARGDVRPVLEVLAPFFGRSRDLLFFEHAAYTDIVPERYTPTGADAAAVPCGTRSMLLCR
jgi:hypothetical protein